MSAKKNLLSEKKNLLILKASAGSGKTYQLVLHYLKFALNKKDLSAFHRILAVTFTNKASQEMKKRIIESLYKLQLPESDADFHRSYAEDLSNSLNISIEKVSQRSKKLLHIILHNYGDLAVMTIDKFVHRLIRSFSKELNVQMDFDVEMSVDMVMNSIADELIAKVGKNEPELTEFIFSMVQESINEGKSWKHKEQISKMARLLIDDEHIESVAHVTQFPISVFVSLKNTIQKKSRDFEEKIHELICVFKERLDEENIDFLDLNYGKNGPGGQFNKIYNKDFSTIVPGKRMVNAIDKENWFKAKSQFHEDESLNAELTKRAQKILDTLKNEGRAYVVLNHISANIYRMALLSEVKSIFEAMKEQDNFLLISEFNQKATSLIMNESVPFIYEKLGERYDHFLIDEFQDTSRLQWSNFLPLIENTLASGQQNLIVGDGKQSIYRFRGAQVEQFQNLPLLLNPKKLEQIDAMQHAFTREGEIYSLDSNFRSAYQIVQFNKHLYDNIFKDKKFSDNEKMKDLFKDHAQKVKNDKEDGYVQLDFHEFNEKAEQEKWILEQTAHTIESISGENAPYTSGDIAILVNKNDEGKKMANYLKEMGIEVISGESLLVHSDYYVQLLWALNKWTLRREDPLVEKEILIAYSRIYKRSPQTILGKYKKRKNDQDIEAFFQDIGVEEHSSSWASLSVYRRNIKWIEQLDFDLTDNAYLQKFLDIIYDFEKIHGPSLKGFVEYFQEEKSKLSIETPKNENAVEILTIHKAKGLQFPVVILPFVKNALTDTSASFDFVSIDTLKLDTPLKQAYIKLKEDEYLYKEWVDAYDKERINRQIDMINSLYVATTRAESEMYIFASKRKQPTLGEKAFQALEGSSTAIEARLTYGQRKTCAEQSTADQKESDVDSEQQDLMLPLHNHLPRQVHFRASSNKMEADKAPDWLEKGEMLHFLLEKTERAKDLPSSYEKCLQKGKIIEEHNLLQLAQKIINSEQIKHFFDDSGTILREQDVADQNGELYRIDRIWMRQDEIHIVDFKLGKKGSKHEDYMRQVTHYVDIIAGMEDKKTKGFIAYTDGAVVEV